MFATRGSRLPQTWQNVQLDAWNFTGVLKAWQAESCDKGLWSEPLHPCNAQERGCMCGIGRKTGQINVSFSLRRFCAAWQVGDIRDDHAYPGPYSSGATETRASVNGEYGGLCMYSEGHSWNSRDQSILSQNDGRGMDNSTMLQVRAASSSFPFSSACPSYCSIGTRLSVCQEVCAWQGNAAYYALLPSSIAVCVWTHALSGRSVCPLLQVRSSSALTCRVHGL